jgi:hypothetical protein
LCLSSKIRPQEGQCIVSIGDQWYILSEGGEPLDEFENEPQINNHCQKFQWIDVQTFCFAIQGLFVLVNVFHFESQNKQVRASNVPLDLEIW